MPQTAATQSLVPIGAGATTITTPAVQVGVTVNLGPLGQGATMLFAQAEENTEQDGENTSANNQPAIFNEQATQALENGAGTTYINVR